MSTPGDDDQADAPVQRTVSAADASPLYSTGASSVFTSALTAFRGTTPPDTGATEHEAEHDEPTEQRPGPATTEPPAAGPTTQAPQEEETMAKRNGAARARKSTRGSPQLQICSALLQNDLSKEDLRAAVPQLTPSQVSSALNNASTHQRVKWKNSEEVYSLTATGRAWLKSADATTTEAEPTKRVARMSAPHRRSKAAPEATSETPAVDTSPTPGKARSFRCAIVNDGVFWLQKNGKEIELDPDETRDLVAYLERMAETTA